MAGNAQITEDVWLSGVMSRRVYRVHGAAPVGAGDAKLLAAPGVFAYAKMDPANVESLRALQAQGFFLVDTNVTLSLDSAASFGTAPPGLRVRMASRSEPAAVLKGVAAVAETSFTFTRFHLDPLVDNGLANRIKREWVGNFFAGARGDALVLAETPAGEVVGFLLTVKNGDRTVIDLIATRPDWQGKGAGAAMVAHLREKNGPAIDVGTQLANLPSLQFYQKLGFRVSGAKYVLHYHSGRAA